MKSHDPPSPDLSTLAKESLEACDGVLARVWLPGPGDSCPACAMRAECPDQRACLHLAASVGLTARLDGPYRRFPIGARGVGRVAIDRKPYVVRGDLAVAGVADAVWLELHGVHTFVAVPLGDGAGGVLALFSRAFLTDREVALLACAARATARERPTPSARSSAAAGPVSGRDPASPAPRTAHDTGGEDRRTLAEIERGAIERALVVTGGRISGPRGAANLLGLKPSTLASRMQKLGVQRPS